MAKNKLNKHQGNASGTTSHKQEKQKKHKTEVEKEIRRKEKLAKKKEHQEQKAASRKQHRKHLHWLITIAAGVIYIADEILDEAADILKDGAELLIDVCAALVKAVDLVADIIDWIITKTFILVARELHDLRMKAHGYRRELLQVAMVALIAATGVIALGSSMTDYQYSYNGKTLGIVKDQQDVLEILELVSEELSQEYGSSITIDPESNITFERVFSYGKQIDDADTVLKRFTYMGDVQAQAFAIYADGELLAILESEQVAQSVLDRVLNNYLKNDDDTEYEYVGFAEEIEIKPYNTSLSKVVSANTAFKKIKSGGQQEVTYKAVSGDTLSGICAKLDVTMSELKKMNPGLDVNDTLHIGDKFVIQQEVPLLTVETVEVSTFAESIDYETEYKESSSYYQGEQVVVRAGKKGKARVTARLTKHNGVTVEKDVLKEVVITEPITKIVAKGTKPVPPRKGTGTFIRPVNVGVYSGYGWRWGRMHYGIDLSCATGTPIKASDGGTVTMSGWNGNYGYCVKIDHGGGYVTVYAHCSALYVSVGEKVYQGQTIAAVGNTGRSTGPHCHFEILYHGKNVNPSNYV